MVQRKRIYLHVCILRALSLLHPVGLRCVCMRASRDTTACVFVRKTSRSVSREMLNEQQVHTSVARREGQVVYDPADLKTTASITFSPETQAA